MNKAFVREPEDTGQAYCPRCGSLGIGVTEPTLEAHLLPEARADFSDVGWFCPFPTCEVAYFDLFERVVTIDRLQHAVYPKDPAAPICPCFGFTTEEIEQDLAEGGVQRTRALVEKTRTPAAHCQTAAASGQCCTAEVQRYYMKRRGG